MRVLITGTSGQVGGALRRLVKGELICPSRAEFDLSRSDGLPGALHAMKPDLILNPAAYTAVDRAEDEPELAMATNGHAPGAIARWAAVHGIPLVHLSTDYVFDGSGERPWREDDAVGPLSAYGRSKLAGEQAVLAAGGPHLVVRTAWVYAAEGANFMRTMIRLAKERETLRVVSDQFGTPTSAATIAGIIVRILEQGGTDPASTFARANGLIHLTNSGYASWHGFASRIIEGARSRGLSLKTREVIPISTTEYPTKAVRPANSRLDLTRLREAYGIVPPDWEQALDSELDAFLSLESAKG